MAISIGAINAALIAGNACHAANEPGISAIRDDKVLAIHKAVGTRRRSSGSLKAGQVIPVALEGRRGTYTHCMFLDDESPIAGGRELWGFPKKLGSPGLKVEKDALVGTLDYGPVRIATGTMGYKH